MGSLKLPMPHGLPSLEDSNIPCETLQELSACHVHVALAIHRSRTRDTAAEERKSPCEIVSCRAAV